MSTFQSARPRSKLPIVLVLILLVIASIAGGAYFFQPRFEPVPPQITIAPNVDIFGVTPLEIQVTDQGAGLKSVTATLSQGGTEHQLASEQFDRPVSEKKIAVALAKAPGVKEGAAVLRVIARDASLWHFFSGNEAMLEKSVTIDITPPTLELIADDRYVNFGGVGVIVNSQGQLGTIQSSARFKDDVEPMNKASEAILALKPVSFRYKEELDPDKIPQFGLIAEEVEKVDPDLVVRDEDGKVSSVRYEAVNAMLLNEFLKEHHKNEEQQATIARQQKQIEALTAGLQKVSAQLAAASPSLADLN